MPENILSLSISSLSFVLSAATAWFTFRNGTVKMSRPTTIFFGPDSRDDSSNPKIYLRTLLFSTSKRGRILESMHVSLSRNQTHQTFNIWVYGEEKLVRGSGLYVGETGVATNHHFLLPKDNSQFTFLVGTYRLEVFAKLLGDFRPVKLFNQMLEVSSEEAQKLTDGGSGLYFDWGPDSSRYHAHVENKQERSDKLSSVELLGLLASLGGETPSNPSGSVPIEN